ncbi:MAG TPA: hypothetical protein VGD79_10180 [Thermoanaerobaculia bacterium]|jgi:hypothetical protein
MPKWTLVLFCLVVCAVAADAQTVVFGPQTFHRAAGAPQTFDATVPIDLGDTCDGRAVYLLAVTNGDGTAAHAVASGSVSVNGVELLRPSDFNNGFQAAERPFEPLATNALRVTLTGGKPGASLTISVKRSIEETVFGEQYTLAGRSGEFTGSFETGDLLASYVAVIRTGAAGGTHVPQSVSVRLNGVEIADKGSLTRRAVTLQAQNHISVSMRGGSGDGASVEVHRLADESLCADAGVTIAITSPADGDAIGSAPLLIRGVASGGRDTGVTVNGMPVFLDTTHAGSSTDPYVWVATLNVVPGPVTLEAVAAAPNGSTASDSVTVSYAPPQDEVVEVSAFPERGTAPLDVQFVVTARTPRPVVRYELDLDGDGTFETVKTTLEEPVPFRYAQPGVTEIAVRAIDDRGTVMSSSTVVEVSSLAAVDAIVQARWRNFLARLTSRDVEGALALLAGQKERDKYRAPLTLIAPSLPQFAAEIATIRPVYVRGEVAHYLLTRTIDGVVHGYPVYFTRGSDGVWKLVQF